MTNPLVSVIVRTYNRAGIIRRAWGELLSKWGDEIKREAGESAFQRHYATACAVLHRAFPAWDDEATMRPFLLRMPA